MTPEKLRGGVLIACWLILCLEWLAAVTWLIWHQNEEDKK